MMSEVRRIPKDEHAENSMARDRICANMALIEEVDSLTREVHTVAHQLSTITKRLFSLKEQIKKAA